MTLLPASSDASASTPSDTMVGRMNNLQLPEEPALTRGISGTRWTAVTVVAETGSTNADLVARAAAGDLVDGAVLIAGHQRTGRGRHSRVWQTPPGQLAVSAAITVPPEQTSAIGWLSLLTGLAVRSAVRDLTGVAVDLKWPNDVLVPAGRPGGGRKLSGILCEFTPVVGGGGVAVIGTGLNLDLSGAQPPIETAWSLTELTGGPADPTAVALAYLRALSAVLDRWPDDLAGLVADYRAASATIGRRVRLVLPGHVEVVGQAVDVDGEGRIVVEGSDGPVAASAGDVTHLRLSD